MKDLPTIVNIAMIVIGWTVFFTLMIWHEVASNRRRKRREAELHTQLQEDVAIMAAKARMIMDAQMKVVKDAKRKLNGDKPWEDE